MAYGSLIFPPVSTKFIIPLAGAEDRDAAVIGPKAMSLARLIGLGLPVPEAVCVSTAAYRAHLSSHGLRDTIRTALTGFANVRTEPAPSELARLRDAIIEAPLSQELTTEVRTFLPALGGGPVAVRSSATKEDGGDLSFAGQHDSILGVRSDAECLAAIKQCWASLWTDRAYAYRARNGIDHFDVEMAVILQLLIPADVSGVIFTADPVTGSRDRITIEGGFGLGEAVVSGRITPDRFELSRDDLAVRRREIATKTVEFVLDDDGSVQERALAAARADEPCVDDVTAARLGKLGLKAEKAFGFPVDLEWAMYDEEFYLLQARPITTIKHRESIEDRWVWTDANTGEVLPDVMTPMTCSVIMPLVDRLFSVMVGLLGADLTSVPVFGVIAGRVYFNLNTFAALGRHVPGISERTMEELFGGSQDEAIAKGLIEIADEDIPDLKIRWWTAIVRLPRMVASLFTLSPKRGNQFVARVSRDTDDICRAQWRSLDDKQVLDRTRRVLDGIVEDVGFVVLAVGLVYTGSTSGVISAATR